MHADTKEKVACYPIDCDEVMDTKGYMVGYHGLVRSENFIKELKQIFLKELAAAQMVFLNLLFSDQPTHTWGSYIEEIESLLDEEASFGSLLKVDDWSCFAKKDATIEKGFMAYKILLTGLEERSSYHLQQKETPC